MKKSILVLLTFVPIGVGYIVNFSIALPVVGMLLFYILPLLTPYFGFIWASGMLTAPGKLSQRY